MNSEKDITPFQPVYIQEILRYGENDKHILISKIVKKLECTDFPYRKYMLSDDNVTKIIQALFVYKATKLNNCYTVAVYNDYTNINYKFNDKYTIYQDNENDFYMYNILTDYFTEFWRVTEKRINWTASPIELWTNSKWSIVQHAITKYRKVDLYSMRESIYDKSYEQSGLKITNTLVLYNLLKVKSILDMCPVYGNRMIAAILTDISYTSVVPDSQVKNILIHISDKLLDFIHLVDKKRYTPNLSNNRKSRYTPKKKQNKVSIVNSLSTNSKYDLIFNSVPMFDRTMKFEEYVFDILNNIRMYWQYLNKNGYMVMYVIDRLNSPKILPIIMAFMSTISNNKLLGPICFSSIIDDNIKRNPTLFWIWQHT